MEGKLWDARRTDFPSKIVSTHEVNLGIGRFGRETLCKSEATPQKKHYISNMSRMIIGGALSIWCQPSFVTSVHYFTVIGTQKMEYIHYWSKPCNEHNFVKFSEFRNCYLPLRYPTILQSPPKYRASFSRSSRWKKAYLPTSSKFSMPSSITPAHRRQ